MNHYSTKLLLLLTIAVATLPLNHASAQNVFPPIAPAKSNNSDPSADADFYFQKTKTQIAELKAFVDSLQKKNSLQEFPYRSVMRSLRDVQQAYATLDQADALIGQLPNHTGENKRLLHKRLTRKLQRLDNYLETVRTGLQASLDPQAFPNLKTDAVRFRGFGISLSNLDAFKTDPTLAATIYRQLPVAERDVDRLKADYDLLIRQETIPGIQLAGLDRYFQSKRKSFLAIAEQTRQALPQRIKNSLDQITEKLKQPTPQQSDQSEASIGLRTQLRKTKADLKLLGVLDPQVAESMASERKQLSDLQARLQKTKPSDNYTGKDRADLLEVLTLSDHKPAANKIRIPSTKWTRQTYWHYNGLQWREIDRSVLSFYVLAHRDGDARLDWQEHFFTKDHLNNDEISVRSVR